MTPRVAEVRFRDELWSAAAPIYAQILAHPFLAGLSDGSLTEQRFRSYVVQDYHYLQGFARALSLIGARAPEDHQLAFFAASVGNVIEVERSLHVGFLTELGCPLPAVLAEAKTPTTTAYLDFLHASTASFEDGVAAVLACYWIYREVGAALVSGGSPEPRYQRWIDTYADESFSAVVDRLLDIVDELGQQLRPAVRARFSALWLRGCRYEWMFWDAAWTGQRWPV